ncbi:MAG: hypothetical protein R3Y06_00610 [Faecalibacterium sp.]
MNWNRIRQPIYVSCHTALNDETYIFHAQSKEFQTLCKSFSAQQSNAPLCPTCHTPQDDIATPPLHQTISVIGERGSGKSSFIHTAAAILKQNQIYAIGPLNPNTFGKRINIMELILAQMQHTICGAECEFLTNNKDALYHKLKKAIHILNQIRRDEKDYLEDTIAAEVLNDYCTMSTFSDLFHEIVQLFLQCINDNSHHTPYQGLAVLIDDVDLVQNQQIYTMLEDISKFLCTNVTVVLAYRNIQLQNALKDSLARENETLLRHKMITLDEIDLQATRYIEKLLPHSTRILLPTEADLYHTKISVILNQVMDDSTVSTNANSILMHAYRAECTLEDWLYKSLLATIRLNLQPMDSKEKTAQQFPSNLRGILEFIKLIWEDLQEPLFSTDNSTDTIDTLIKNGKIVLKNIDIYRNYLRSYMRQTTLPNHYHILEEWEMAPAENKNFTLYLNLYRTFFTSPSSVKGDHLLIEKTQPFNVALADVYTLLEDFKGLSAPETASHSLPAQNNVNLHFVYCIKIFYSLALTEAYLTGLLQPHLQPETAYDHVKQMEDRVELQPFYIYQCLLNCYAIPSYVMEELTLQYPDRYSFTFAHNKDRFKTDTLYHTLIAKISFTALGLHGDIAQSARPLAKDQSRQQSQVQRSYQYRHYFNANNYTADHADWRTDKRTYSYDVFGFLCSAPSTLSTLTQKDPLSYVLLSLFDIDRFVYANYARRSENHPLAYFLRCINLLLAAETNKQSRRTTLNPPPLHQDSLPTIYPDSRPESYVYCPAYSKEEMKLLLLTDAVSVQTIVSNAQTLRLKKSVGTEQPPTLELLHELAAIIDNLTKDDVITHAKHLLAVSDIAPDLTDRIIELIVEIDHPNTRLTTARKATFRELLEEYTTALFNHQQEE